MENEQQPGEKSSNTKQQNSSDTSVPVEANIESRFQLRDLLQLIYEIGNETDPPLVLDCWSSSAEQFGAFIRQFGEIEDDVSAWGPFDRLEYVNDLWEYCEANAFTFPFHLKPVAQPVKRSGEGAR